MPRFAANLTMMYTEWPFLERFQAAAEDGFKGVEFQYPYAHPAAEIAARLEDAGLVPALINAPAGNWEAGERGLAALPERHEPDSGEVNYAYLFGLIDDLGYAGWVGCEYRPRNGTRAGLGWFARWR